jgi:hypothetical protein
MPSDGVSTKLTVYFDGQFWVALCERQDDGRLFIARHAFGPEPSLPQIAELVAGARWSELRFLPAAAASGVRRPSRHRLPPLPPE